ncbi:hypothetical protein ACIA8H_35480 [Streptomyces goshikiensis]|uniref:hypothetical protein n=1 Tax=Streptomyces goshikiensis TaxID=1942 RepID=UPI0037B9F71F
MDARQVYDGWGGERCELVPGRVLVDLAGGPLDGRLLDVSGWRAEGRAEGSLLVTDLGLYGPGGRAFYTPAETDLQGDRPFRWRLSGPCARVRA